jgi:ADP-ribosylglycohydrolase
MFDPSSPPMYEGSRRLHGSQRTNCTGSPCCAAPPQGRTAGNGSLMRTAPVALAYLDHEKALMEAARTVSELTYFDSEAALSAST